ncbi:MAG: hypothetical protein Q8O09_01350 [Bacillota bacterium]|nr:hypothetical protein [Bacillota bacterium]
MRGWLITVAILCFVLFFISGIVGAASMVDAYGNSVFRVDVMFLTWAMGIIFGSVFLGFASIIKYLKMLKDKV